MQHVVVSKGFPFGNDDVDDDDDDADVQPLFGACRALFVGSS